MRSRRYNFRFFIILLLCATGVGCRTAEQNRRDTSSSNRFSLSSISFHGGKKSDVRTDEDLIADEEPIDSGKVPGASQIDEAEKLASATPFLDVNTPPIVTELEQPAISNGLLSQQKFVSLLKGQIEFSKDGHNRVDLSGTSVSNAHLRELPTSPAIDHLNISKTKISDAGLLNIGGHNRLKLLRLDETNCTDASLEPILKLTNLELLGLSKTAVSDRGLEQLAKSKTLRFLLLDDTNITDQGINSLGFIKTLEGVSLLRTNVSPEAVERLKLQLPKCSVVYDGSKPKATANHQPGHSTMHSVSFQDDSHRTPLQRSDVPEWLQDIERANGLSKSQSAVSEPRTLQPLNSHSIAEKQVEKLPLIHPLHRNYVLPNSSYGWANDSRPNQQGYMGARQSMTPAQTAARVGFTSPVR